MPYTTLGEYRVLQSRMREIREYGCMTNSADALNER